MTNSERRIYEDEHAFADRAAWLDAHQIKEDRRKPRNIINECNSQDGCYSMENEDELSEK